MATVRVDSLSSNANSEPPQATPHRFATAGSRLDAAIDRTATWLLEQQHADGYWCAELEGDTILESETILLLAWLGREGEPAARRAGNTILQKQRPEGGWPLYPGGPLDISVSVKAYFALKLTGHDPKSAEMRKAKSAIRDHGGAERVNSFTRFYLALLGQIPYSLCPAVPPEMTLLPTRFPINLYRISAWSRTIFVPLSIVWTHRPQRALPSELGIEELFVNPPSRWPKLRKPGQTLKTKWLSWENTFNAVDRCLKLAEWWHMKPLRRRALRKAERWMIDRFADSDGLGAIFPPIIWSVIALKCLGYDDDSPEVVECLSQLEALAIDEGETRRFQPCKSPVWDTTITLRALAQAGASIEKPQAERGVQWLLEKEVRARGDWAETVEAEPGGWFFEHRNAFYPDVDDTVMALLALNDQFGGQGFLSLGERPGEGTTRKGEPLRDHLLAKARPAARRAISWTLAMQNRDGGWGAFDRDNDAEFLCHVPFADHNAMIDPSTPDLTGRVLEALGAFGRKLGDPAVDRAVAYLRRTQEPDGAWLGRWGVNYIYGTWQTIVGLVAIGVPTDDPAVHSAAQWLIDHQQPSGAWGESPATYQDPALRGQGPPTASQTAWALLGLIAAGQANHEAAKAGVDWLLSRQQADGTWDESEFTGTGFPQVFYLRYHYYRIYFPLLALAGYRKAVTVA